MELEDKIFLAGHRGLVGSAIERLLVLKGFSNIITLTREELDLTNQSAVKDFFEAVKPKYVILAAAKVGGIHANDSYPADFIYENLMIEANVIDASYQANVSRLLFLGSTCIYPKAAEQPMREDALLTGVLESTNEPYAIAKIAGIKLCESYNREYGTDYRSLMPTNLYGPNDNFQSKNAHVIPALISKFHVGKLENKPFVEVWGSGRPLREFLYVDDLAEASIHIMGLDKKILESKVNPMLSHINIGTGEDTSIKDLAQIIKDVVGFCGEIVFNTEMPDGVKRKQLDVSKIENMGWRASMTLKNGLEETYDWFLKNNRE